MQRKFLGDSYDIVKRSLLHALLGPEKWSVYPMITTAPNAAEFTEQDIRDYERLLGASVVRREVLTPDEVSDDLGRRVGYFTGITSFGHLFVDPDTGVRHRQSCARRRRRHYLFLDELVWLVEQRSAGSLTVVYDQSVGRGEEERHVTVKLQYLTQKKICAFAYRAHPCFIVAGRDRELVDSALSRVQQKLALPSFRLIKGRI